MHQHGVEKQHQNTIWSHRDDIKQGDNLHNGWVDERMDEVEELQDVEVFHFQCVCQKV